MPTIITVAEYKTYAGVASSTTTFDTIFGEIIDNAEGRAEDYCDRVFAQATHTDEILDGTGGDTLQLRNPPVTDPVTSVSLRTGVDSWTALESSSYYLQAREGLLIRVGGWPIYRKGQIVAAAEWPEGHANIKCTYEGGYATPPEGLKSAIYKLTDWLFAERRFNPAMLAEGLGGVTIQRPAFNTLNDLLEFHLAKYRKGDVL